MPRGNASGIRLNKADIPFVLGMQKRGDRDHDIAAWFGVNQGRVAEAKDGRYAHITPAPATSLPPKGPPGLKGRDLRDAVQRAITLLQNDSIGSIGSKGVSVLVQASKAYDQNNR